MNIRTKRFSLYQQKVLCLSIWQLIVKLMGLQKGNIVEVSIDVDNPVEFRVRKVEDPEEENA